MSPAEGVEFPVSGAVITAPPAKKFSIYLKTLDAGLHLPLTDFQEELLRRNGCSVQMLMPNAVHKMVAFEIICRANGILLDFFVFKYFFRFGATGDKYTFSTRHGGYNLVPDSKTPKNQQEKWLWINRDLLVREPVERKTFPTSF